MEVTHNVVGWIEIPVLNMERAVKFYEAVLDYKLSRYKLGTLDMALFPWVADSIGSGCALVYQEDYYKPSGDGVLIYITAFSGDVANEISKVEENGGKVLFEKKQISPEHGYMAVFLDTEGNRIAIHSRT